MFLQGGKLTFQLLVNLTIEYKKEIVGGFALMIVKSILFDYCKEKLLMEKNRILVFEQHFRLWKGNTPFSGRNIN